MVRLSSLSILVLLCSKFITSFENEEAVLPFTPFEIDGCSPTLMNAQSELYDKVKLDFQVDFPLKVVPFKGNTTHEFDRTVKLYRNVTVKRFTGNCETLFIFLPISDDDSIKLLDDTNTLSFMLNSYTLKRDRAVFISHRKPQSYNLQISQTLVASRLKYIYFFPIGDSYLSDILFHASYSDAGFSISAILDNLSGRHLNVTTLPFEPYVLIRDNSPIGGVWYNLIKASSAAYNFTFTYDCPRFRGIADKNGTFIGAVGAVASGERDIMLGLVYTPERSLYMDFSDFGIRSGLNYLAPLPKTVVHWNAILGTFQLAVWSLLCSTVILLIILLYTVSHVGSQERRFGFFNTFNMIVSPLLEKSFQDPRSGKVRIMAIPWMVTSIITLTYFKSDFIAFLTNPEYEYVPSTNAELAAHPEYTIRIRWINGAEAEFFKGTTSPVHLNIYSRLIRDDDMLKCVQATAFDFKTVCMYYDVFRETNIAKNMTLISGVPIFTKSKDYVFPTIISMAFPKDSKYVVSFSRITGFLRDTGLLNRWVHDVLNIRKSEGRQWLVHSKSSLYHQLNEKLKEKLSSGINPLEFTNLYGGFAALFLAAIAAVITMICECLIGKYPKYGQFRAQSPTTIELHNIYKRELWTFANNFTRRELDVFGIEINGGPQNLIIVKPQEPATFTLSRSNSGEGPAPPVDETTDR